MEGYFDANKRIRTGLVTLALFIASPCFGEEHTFTLASPDKNIAVEIEVNQGVSYQIALDGKSILLPSNIDLQLESLPSLSDGIRLTDKKSHQVNEVLEPEVRVKSQKILDSYNQLSLSFSNNYTVTFRAYNNGIAYRFETDINQDIVVIDELAEFNFPAPSTTYFPKEEGFYSHNERSYLKEKVSDITATDLASTPTLIDTEAGKLLITETALENYAGLWLIGSEKGLKGTFAHYPTQKAVGEAPWQDRNEPITHRAKYIAKSSGKRTYPWRVLAIAKQDKDLLTNQLTYQLAIPSKLADTSWIKPGKVAWDWFNANNLHGVDFEAGLNTATYKHYIDFAAEYGLEYVILDEGWYPLGDLMGTVADFDVPELIRYGKEKGVGIILWASWLTLRDQFDEAMDRFQQLGAVGIKPDFFQRDDQEMVQFYWKIAKEAAERELLVDFHGSYKPAGLRRTYPNVISREGVKGLEWNKWSYDSTPEHNTTLPFIRQVVGPMDYTPGVMSNAIGPAAFENINYSGKDSNHQDFTIRFMRPMSQTTRVHQMAMFTVFESPLQMMADTPSQYRKNSECAAFIAKVPTVWDETIPLEGSIGDFVMVARKHQSTWHVGAMTDENARTLPLDLSFLEEGKWKMVIFEDGPNAKRWAEDYRSKTLEVTNETKLNISLAPGGGYTARLSKM